jgi:hypothetical protein
MMFSAVRELVTWPLRLLTQYRHLPSPATVQKLGPATSFTPTETTLKPGECTSKVDRDAADALCQLLDLQVLEGRQVGVQVAVYRHGEQVLSVCAGVCQSRTSNEWQVRSLVLHSNTLPLFFFKLFSQLMQA